MIELKGSVFAFYRKVSADIVKFGFIGLYKSFKIFSVASKYVFIVIFGELGVRIVAFDNFPYIVV